MNVPTTSYQVPSPSGNPSHEKLTLFETYSQIMGRSKFHAAIVRNPHEQDRRDICFRGGTIPLEQMLLECVTPTQRIIADINTFDMRLYFFMGTDNHPPYYILEGAAGEVLSSSLRPDDSLRFIGISQPIQANTQGSASIPLGINLLFEPHDSSSPAAVASMIQNASIIQLWRRDLGQMASACAPSHPIVAPRYAG